MYWYCGTYRRQVKLDVIWSLKDNDGQNNRRQTWMEIACNKRDKEIAQTRRDIVNRSSRQVGWLPTLSTSLLLLPWPKI